MEVDNTVACYEMGLKKFYSGITRGLYYIFYGCNCSHFIISLSVFHFNSSLIFLGKARSLTLEWGAVRDANLVSQPCSQVLYKSGSGQHSSLLQNGISNGRKKFYSGFGRGQYYRTFYGCNCYHIIISLSVCPFHPSLILLNKARSLKLE